MGIVLRLVMVAVFVLATMGMGGTSDKQKASPRLVSRANVVQPGSRAKPIPIGKTAAIGGGWWMRVLAVTPNANQQVLAVKRSDGGPANSPPPPGAQDFMVRLSLTYLGKGKNDTVLVVDYGLKAMGVHNKQYTAANSCGQWPEPSLQHSSEVLSGNSVQGNVCLQIAANDAKTLKLYTADPVARLKQVWFALR